MCDCAMAGVAVGFLKCEYLFYLIMKFEVANHVTCTGRRHLGFYSCSGSCSWSLQFAGAVIYRMNCVQLCCCAKFKLAAKSKSQTWYWLHTLVMSLVLFTTNKSVTAVYNKPYPVSSAKVVARLASIMLKYLLCYSRILQFTCYYLPDILTITFTNIMLEH